MQRIVDKFRGLRAWPIREVGARHKRAASLQLWHNPIGDKLMLSVTALVLLISLGVSTPQPDTLPAIQPEPQVRLPMNYDRRCLTKCVKHNNNDLPLSCFELCDMDSDKYRSEGK